jgi:hypothetical protein
LYSDSARSELKGKVRWKHGWEHGWEEGWGFACRICLEIEGGLKLQGCGNLGVTSPPIKLSNHPACQAECVGSEGNPPFHYRRGVKFGAKVVAQIRGVKCGAVLVWPPEQALKIRRTMGLTGNRDPRASSQHFGPSLGVPPGAGGEVVQGAREVVQGCSRRLFKVVQVCSRRLCNLTKTL